MHSSKLEKLGTGRDEGCNVDAAVVEKMAVGAGRAGDMISNAAASRKMAGWSSGNRISGLRQGVS